MRYFLISLVCLSLLVGAGARAAEHYSEWGDGNDKYDALVERLNTLIDAAERARAADPRLLRDLRDAIAGQSAARPGAAPELPPQMLVHDDFRDGNFTRDPAWTVAEGRFSIDSGLGLRSFVAPPSAAAKKSSKEQRKDLVVGVLSTLLSGTDKQKSSASTQPSEPRRAEIFIRAPISNAFQLVFEIVSREKRGRFSLDLFQGRSRGAGYRLSYAPGGRPSLELLRFGASGIRSIVASNQALDLEDGFRHRIEFSRGAGGAMTVSVDGGQLLNATDQSFRDPFNGVTIANDGGDYSLREITVFGGR